MKALQVFFKYQKNHFKKNKHGFTLLELMIGLVIAFIVITPLLTFVTTILDTYRREEAKANTEQEVEAALEYIGRDLKQALYIYDATALDNISSSNPANSGIKDQIPPLQPLANTTCINNPPDNVCLPILAFWKREYRKNAIPISQDEFSGSETFNDTFVYSLVVYYLLKGNHKSDWSNLARIGRFQITDGVKDPLNIGTNDNVLKYIEQPSDGFQLFNLRVPGSITLQEKMNSWRKAPQNYTTTIDTLVDFIDVSTNKTTANCPTNMQQIPSTLLGGFYACIDSANTSAQVYIKGNSFGRIRDNAVCDRAAIYCPSATLQVQGRGLLNNN